MTKAVRVIPFESIERRFRLSGLNWFGAYRPAVAINGPLGGYIIRVIKCETHHHSQNGSNTNVTYDYFELADDGTVLVAPRGFAKDYKPGRITGMDEAVKKYAGPVAP